MTRDSSAVPASPQLARQGLAAATAILGVLGAHWLAGSHALLDTPARPAWVALASLVTLALAVRRAPSGVLLAYVAVSMASLIASQAVGSTWAIFTWWPIVIAAVEVARVSPFFLLTLSATLLVLTAPVLAITQAGSGGTGTSGSTVYFAGFVAAVAVPIWFHRAWKSPNTLWDRLLASVAVIVSALALWSAFASGSRAVVLALTLATLGYLAAVFKHRSSTPSNWRRFASAAATVAVLVIGLDYGLGLVFDTGGTIAPVVAGRVEATTVAVTTEGPNSGSTRLALWMQAAKATVARPLGHGLGSYQHVILSYQDAPMLWSASPHNAWALAAVETGVPGLALLLALSVAAARSAWRRSPAALGALVAATVVMALDVFGSMPINALVWWAVVGTALGSTDHRPVRWSRAVRTIGAGAVVAIALVLAIRLATPCNEGCEPIVQYGGLPRQVGYPTIIGDDPTDPRWALWSDRYPTASWLAFAKAGASDEHDALLILLRTYPYHSARTYLEVANLNAPDSLAAQVAACGLVRFFDGRPIWRDWRSSAAELDQLREALAERAGTEVVGEASCVAAGIPSQPIGLR